MSRHISCIRNIRRCSSEGVYLHSLYFCMVLASSDLFSRKRTVHSIFILLPHLVHASHSPSIFSSSFSIMTFHLFGHISHPVIGEHIPSVFSARCTAVIIVSAWNSSSFS